MKKSDLKINSPHRCSVTGELRKNVLTYHIDAGDGELISTSLREGMLHEGCSQRQIEHEYNSRSIEPDEEGVIFQFTVTVKKIMTQKEVNELPEKY